MNGGSLRKQRGFSLLELIVVLVIIAALASLAIPRFAGSDAGVKLASMKEDARNAITVARTYYTTYQQFPSGTADASASTTAVRTQLTAPGGGNSPYYISASPGNTVSITAQTCADGTAGFTVSVTNADLPNTVDYDSCTDAGIQVN